MTIQEPPILRAEDRAVLERLQAAMGSEGKKSAIEIMQAWSGDNRESVQTQKLKNYWEGYHLLHYITHIKNTLEASARDRLIKLVVKHIHRNGFAAIQSFPTSGKTTGIAAHRVSSIFKVAGGFRDHSRCIDEDHGEQCSATDLTECRYSLLMGMLGYFEFCRDQQLPVEQFIETQSGEGVAGLSCESPAVAHYTNGLGLDQTINSIQNFLATRNTPQQISTVNENAPLPSSSKVTASPSIARGLAASYHWRRALLVAWLLVFIVSAAWWLYPKPNAEQGYQQAVNAVNNKKYANAISALKQVLEANSEFVDAYYLLAEIYTTLADTENAIQYYRAGIEKDSHTRPQAYNNLALLLLAQDRVSDTLVLLDQAEANISAQTPSEQWTQMGVIFKNRAWAHWKMGSNAQALTFINNAQKFLSSAQKLDQYPEIFCLHALIAKADAPNDEAAEECIARFKKHQKNQISANEMLPPLSGVSYDLYLQVLKLGAQ